MLTIEGVRSLHGARVAIIPDRIETGSYACAAAVTGGSIHLRHGRVEHLGAVVRSLAESGVDIVQDDDGVTVSRRNGLHGIDFITEPYPGFPTDMQAQLMALLSVAEGASMITENIFEERLGHRARHPAPVGRAGDGQRPARQLRPDRGRPGRARRNGGQPRLPSRPWLRSRRGQAGRLRSGHRTSARLRLPHRSKPV
jgi:hypothetical protein